MARINRGRGKTSRTTKNVSDENKHSTDAPNGSGSHSLATPPALDDYNHVAVWDPDAAPIESSWGIPVGDWNNPEGDNTWQWEAAGDGSIASDDPFKDKKLAYRNEIDHVYSSEYRVRRWREKLPVKRLLLSRAEDIETPVDSPPEAELWNGRSGCRLQSRERSRSRGRQGRREREAIAEEWKEKVELMIAQGALAKNDPDSFADSLPGTFSEDLQRWLNKVVQKPKWSHVKKSKAKAFFESSMREKISQVERLSRELANGPSWNI